MVPTTPRMPDPDFVLALVRELERLTIDMTSHEIAQVGVDLAQRATHSAIAYLHFLNEDQNTIELGVWSHDTLTACTAVYDRHYPIEQAGIWADTARARAVCLHNDYAAVTTKRGLPDGHVPLQRHLGLPLIHEGRVRMLVGVGNKATDYDEADVDLLQLVADRVWSVIRQRRMLEGYQDLEHRFAHLEEAAHSCGFEYDVDDDRLRFDTMFRVLFGLSEAVRLPASVAEFTAYLADFDRDRVAATMRDVRTTRHIRRILGVRSSGEEFPMDLKLQFRPRDLGRGMIAVGVLQDLSERAAFDDLRRRADVDPLTGLANRNVLAARFDAGRHRRAEDAFAFHYIDLDGFKPVNDTLGHAAGDEVLRIVAARVRALVRDEDLVVRMGGDEFAVLQAGVPDEAAATALAGKLVHVVREPIATSSGAVRVYASIGTAVSSAGRDALHEVAARADRALYQAKAAGGDTYVLAAARP